MPTHCLALLDRSGSAASLPRDGQPIAHAFRARELSSSWVDVVTPSPPPYPMRGSPLARSPGRTPPVDHAPTEGHSSMTHSEVPPPASCRMSRTGSPSTLRRASSAPSEIPTGLVAHRAIGIGLGG